MNKKTFTAYLLLLAVSALLSMPLEAAKKPVLEPSFAWRVDPLLGQRSPATIDTVFQNYSLEFVPQQISPAYATTGNYCAEGYNLLYMERPIQSDFHFRDALEAWSLQP